MAARWILGMLFASAVAGRAVGADAPAPVQNADPRVGCSTITSPVVDLGEPENIDLFKKRLIYYRCTAYESDLAKVLADAERWIAVRAPQVARPAIVLDIDETSLSNWPRIYQDDFAYIPIGNCDFERGVACGDLEWQRSGQAQAIAPTLKLYRVARCLGQPEPCTKIDVFFVTGRSEIKYKDEMPSAFTLRNLARAGYDDVASDHLYLRDAGSPSAVADYKTSKRIDIENRGFTIIASIGDQKSDLAGGHAEMTYKLPNPFYFIP